LSFAPVRVGNFLADQIQPRPTLALTNPCLAQIEV
jgi:hypothetical protein